MTEEIFSNTYWARIYIAGDYDRAREICKEYVMKGLCINISKVDYIYTMGEETGVCVEIINYPIFNKEPYVIKLDSILLANELMKGLHQASYTIMCPDETYYFSRKQDIREKNKTSERVTPHGINIR